VYVHATLGALGYVFTKLMVDIGRYDEPGEVRELVEMGMRIPAAWILGAGFYVNVAIKSLGSLANRMLGRGRNPSG